MISKEAKSQPFFSFQASDVANPLKLNSVLEKRRYSEVVSSLDDAYSQSTRPATQYSMVYNLPAPLSYPAMINPAFIAQRPEPMLFFK